MGLCREGSDWGVVCSRCEWQGFVVGKDDWAAGQPQPQMVSFFVEGCTEVRYCSKWMLFMVFTSRGLSLVFAAFSCTYGA